ncbi:hypothetical protein PSHT_09460 [Puccinia striiformis]|uniref:Uncharacterized protein n=1 Tax=Puccinia striiformis TaxID=27350 RepID=A0A2S4VGT8_9BASI|nr:hypothetical protein PSHT_09460 [Puccinia striiformis]
MNRRTAPPTKKQEQQQQQQITHHHLNETTRSISRSNSFDTVPPHSPNPSDTNNKHNKNQHHQNNPNNKSTTITISTYSILFLIYLRGYLNSLLWLAPHPPSLKFQEFLSINSIEFNDLGIQHAASLDAVTEEAVTHA